MERISYIEDYETWKKDFRFSTTIRVRFSETDLFGHMNNVSAFIYFEQARIEFLHHIGLTLSSENEGIPIVADLQCDFHQQIYFNDPIKIFVKANHVGRSSIDLHYMVLNEKEEICLTGRGALVYIDQINQRPIQIPQNMAEKLQKGQ